MISLIRGIKKLIPMNLFTNQKETQNKLMVTEGERWGTDKLGIWHSKGDCKGRKTKSKDQV